MVRRGPPKTPQSGGIVRPSRGPTTSRPTTCKTCTPCRQKKIKCTSGRPQCEECINGALECVYPSDGRRQPRPSQARVESLEATVSAMLEHMKASGIVLPSFAKADESGDNVDEALDTEGDTSSVQLRSTLLQLEKEADYPNAAPFPSPSTSTSTGSNDLQQKTTPGSQYMFSGVEVDMGGRSDFSTVAPKLDLTPPKDHYQQQQESPPDSLARPDPVDEDSSIHGLADETADEGPSQEEFPVTDLSPCEARVAGVFHEDGRVSSVHGLAGIINPTLRSQHTENISKVCRRGEAAISATKARLISNAALQRQRESSIFRQPQNRQTLDLDGCCPELAKHLLDIHFSRHDSTRLTLYRPAIMGCIANGGGPWVNKLLLNAVYYSSCLYSERDCFQSEDGPKEKGNHYYDRFRQLLIEELGQPSIPTASALLLTSTTLVSRGKIKEGWVLSGMAYRMIIDLGCHLMLAPDYEETAKSQSGSYQLHRDMEQEMRKRLYWGAFVTDVTQSLYLGRPCMFATQEARVPLRFLDTFEEMNEWQPYSDHSSSVSYTPTQAPQPAHTLSSFTSLIRLMQIGADICDMYGIHAMKYEKSYVIDKKMSIERRLQAWSNGLPKHMHFDIESSSAPPPHQFTPFVMFHTFQILLHRAFTEEGHLRRHSNPEMKHQCEESCIADAMMIGKYMDTYRKAFTLRYAPFCISYAVYSAATIILRQERHDRGHFIGTISFFWDCLGELAEGCNFGLQRPLSILRDMVQEFYQTVKEKELENSGNPHGTFGDLDRSAFSYLPLSDTGSVHGEGSTPPMTFMAALGDGAGEPSLVDYSMMDQLDFGFDNLTPGVPGFLTDEESNLSQNYLYGLFAP